MASPINGSTINAAEDMVTGVLKSSRNRVDDAGDARRALGHADDAADAAHAGTMDKIVEGVSTAVDVPNKVAMFGVLPLMAGGALVKGVGYLADGRNDAAAPGRISSFGHTMTAPVRFINRPFHYFGEKTGLGKPVGAAVGWAGNTLGSPVDWLANKTGFNDWRVKRHDMHAKFHHDQALGILSAENGHKIEESFGKIKELNRFQGLTGKVKAAAGDAAKMAALHPELSEFEQVVKGVHPRLLPANTHGFATSARDAAWHHHRSAHWKDGRGARDSTKLMSHSAAGHAAWNAGFIGMDSIAIYGTAKTFTENLHSLKQMYADMTGKDVNSVSTRAILMGSVPAPVAEERSKLLKCVGVDGVLQTIGLLFSIHQFRGGHFSTKAGLFQGMTAFASEPLKGLVGQSNVPFYASLSEAHKRGEAIPAEAYAEFIARLDPHFTKLGAKHSRTKAVAEKLAHDKASLGSILNLYNQGKLDALDHAARTQPDNANPAPAAQHETKGHSHVQALKEGNPQNMGPAVGKYTGDLLQKALEHKTSPVNMLPPIPGRP